MGSSVKHRTRRLNKDKVLTQARKRRGPGPVSFLELDRATQYGLAIESQIKATSVMPMIPILAKPGHFTNSADLVEYIVAKQPHAQLEDAPNAEARETIAAAQVKREKKNAKRKNLCR